MIELLLLLLLFLLLLHSMWLLCVGEEGREERCQSPPLHSHFPRARLTLKQLKKHQQQQQQQQQQHKSNNKKGKKVTSSPQSLPSKLDWLCQRQNLSLSQFWSQSAFKTAYWTISRNCSWLLQPSLHWCSACIVHMMVLLRQGSTKSSHTP